MMLGKVVTVEEKRELKKGAKEHKEQPPKTVEKFSRMLIEKAPGQMELFEDAIAAMSDEYSDLTAQFVERGKEQINYYGQFVDNDPSELEAWTTALNSKLDLAEYLRDPLNHIKKFPESSPYYLEYTCKLLRRAVEAASESEYPLLLSKSEELGVPTTSPAISVSQQIHGLMMEAIANDIEWVPSAKDDLVKLQ
jgi:hypothetical protein